MKWSFLLFSSFLCLQAIAQYPATGNKARLGWQTTGDGLVYRGAIGDTATLDPSGLNNAWMLLDTANGNLYAYRAKAWRLVSGGGGGGGVTMPFDSVTFNVNETDASQRELKYSEEKGYLQYGGLDSVQIPLLPGIWYVRNDTSITIPKGTVVRATGTLGASGRIKVKHMIANGSIDAMYILGIAMQDIAVGADGYVMTQGKIRQVNTQAYSEGAVLYADVDTLGGLTQTEPTGSNLKLPIAFVVHSASNGTLAVRVSPGTYLRDLHDVYITSPASNASLYYNTSESVWRDTTGAVLTSDTSVFARDFQISGTAGQVAYFNAANAVTSDTAFRWSAANKTLGINTSTTSGANIIIKNSQEPSRSTVVSTQTFAADTTNWTRGTGWTFNGTAAVATAATGNLTYTPALTITSGNAYEITYTLSGYSAGTLTVAVGNATYVLPTHNATANVVVLLPTSATGGFRFTTSTFTGNLDNVSVVEVSKPLPLLIAGQDDNSSTLYEFLKLPNNSSISLQGGGSYVTGINNSFFGETAGFLNTTGQGNNFFGYRAGYNNSTGQSNNFFGRNAGFSNTIGTLNNFFGGDAGTSNTTGSNNNFFGSDAGRNNTTGLSNNFFGFAAGLNNTTGSRNNFFGDRAGQANTTGGDNNFFGREAGLLNTTGSRNIFIGFQSGNSNISGDDNVMAGITSGFLSTVGSLNVFVGVSAGRSNRRGNYNVAIGSQSMYNLALADTLTGDNNIAIGRNAAENISAAAAGNVAIGNRVYLPTSNGSNQGVYQNVLFFTGASGTGTTIAAGSRAGIKTNAPASDFHVAGEVRINDLKPTGAPRNIVGSSSTGDLSTMAWGNGLTVSVGDTILRADTSVLASKTWVNNKINADTISLSNRINTKLNISDTSVFARDWQIAGTTNRLAKFTGTSSLGDSPIVLTGDTLITFGTAAPGLVTINTKDFPNTPTDMPYTKFKLNNGYGVSGIYMGDPTGPLSASGMAIQLTAWDGSSTPPSYLDYYSARLRMSGTGDFYIDNSTASANGNGSMTTRFTINNAGRVGIATASPSRPLHINETSAIRLPVGNFAERGTSGAGDIRVRSDTANLEFHNGTSWQTVINNADTSVFARDVQISGTANRLAMFTGSNAVGNSIVTQNGRSMYINSTQDNSGYTISNLFQFNGFGSSAFDQPSIAVIGNVGTTANHRPYLSMYRSAGSTVDDKTLVPYNYYLGSITWQGADGSDFQSRGAEITAITDSITGVNDMPTALFFGTTANGQEQPTERMRITSAGNVGIGTSDPASFGSSQLAVVKAASRSVYNTWLYSNSASNVNASILRVGGSGQWVDGKEESIDLGFSRISSYYKQGAGGGWGLKFKTYTASDFATNESTVTIDPIGNVGINTTTPSRRLHVEGETRISDLTTDPATRIVGADADGDLDAITIGNGVTFSSDTLKADTSVLATKTYVTDNAISTVYIPINLYAPGDTVANTTNSKAFFLVHSGLNGYCIDSYTVKAISGSGTADIQIDKNGTGANTQAISGTTVATKDTNIALATGDYIRGQVFNLSGTLVGLGLTLEIKKTCN